MQKITNKNLFIYGTASIVVAALMVFVVLPQLPQVAGSNDSVSTAVNQAEAYGTSGCSGCDGPGSDGPGGGEGDNSPKGPSAICQSFTANKSSVPHGGGNVKLSWRTDKATSVSISGIGKVGKDESMTVFVNKNTTFTLTAYGAGGNSTCKVTIKVEKKEEKPAAKCVSFTANKSSVPAGGGNVKLTWNTQNATSVSISGGIGTVAAKGSHTVNVTKNTTFTLTAKGAGGNDSCTVTIKVDPEPPVKPAAKCVSFTANKSSVPYGGGNVKLTWKTQNANSVSINNGVGNVTPVNNGSITVNVTKDTTFTLTTKGAGGNDSCTVTVKVEKKEEKPVAKCVSFTANKASVPAGGGNVKLTWNTQNATSVSISGGIGNVTPVNNGSITVNVTKDTTFTLTAKGTGGNDTCMVKVTVETKTEKTPHCDYLTASDSRVESGDRVTLKWSTTNANQVTISPKLGSVSASGSESVVINNDTTFTLYARNTSTGKEDTCKVTVRVEEDGDDEPTPRCDFDASKSRVAPGGKVTLSWNTDNADRVTIRDDRNRTIFDTDTYRSSERRRYMDGEVDVIVNQTTEFTLTARGEGGSRTCRVEVKVDDLAVYEKRDQGYVIALTQVPYTGFEAGPFLTFLFYAVLTLWALFVAYVLVIKKGSIMGLSLYGKAAGMTATDAENRKKVEALVAKYQGLNGN